MLETHLIYQGRSQIRQREFKLEPRSDDVGLQPALRGFPEELFVETGFSGVPTGGFAIALTRAAESDITVSMSGSDSIVSVSDVTIAAGQISADVSITLGMAAPGQTVTLTATYDGKSVTATIYPYQDGFPRYPTQITLADRIVRPNGLWPVTSPEPSCRKHGFW